MKNSDGDYTVYTGIKNVPSIKGGNTTAPTESADKVSAAYYCKTNGMATVMFIDASAANVEITSDSSKAIYLAGESKSELITDKNTKVDYYEFNAVVDGEITTVKVRSDVTLETNAVAIATGVAGSSAKNYLYGGATYNADGIITSFSNNTNTKGSGIATDKLSGDYNVKLGSVSWTVAEDAKIWTIDEDGVISAGTIKSVKKDANDTFIYTAKDGEITNLFVQEVKDGTEVITPVTNDDYKANAAFDPTDASKIIVKVKNGTSNTDARATAIAFLKGEGYTDVKASGMTLTATKDLVQETYTVTVKYAYEVTFTTADANVTCNPSKVYAAEGDVVKVAVTNGYANWDSIRTWTDSTSSYTCGTATGTGKVQTVPVTVGTISTAATVTLAWS